MSKRCRAVAAATALGLTAGAIAGCSGAKDQTSSKPSSITVWLQPEASQTWPQMLAAANKAFKAKYGVDVKVETQTWTDHLTKLDTALAGSTPPDVVELGNTEMARYMAAGAFADLTAHKQQFPNSAHWVRSLTDSATYEGKLYGVPYYGGSRAVIYNKDLFAKAGITTLPKTIDELIADGRKLAAANAKKQNFSAFYMPGRYNWAGPGAFVENFGGHVAVKSGGKWKGTLDSPQAVAGLTKFKELVTELSKADRRGDDSTQDQTFAQGNAAMLYGLGREVNAITDPEQGGDPALSGKLGAFPMPGVKEGQPMPAFIGGSNLAAPAKGGHQDLARAWMAIFTNDANETQIARKNLVPNSTTLISQVPSAARPFAESAKSSWFVPVAEGWGSVEQRGILTNMVVDILNGANVQEAARKSSGEISTTLNAGR
ncbi:extracellular solute-binding protein [Streptomyces sp. NPDC058459]|uniref:extracellular solute-binding protein n=1 Tax=Streptomyces sp. NPDC058459 TaxID=3346508 RepID=UPI003665B919